MGIKIIETAEGVKPTKAKPVLYAHVYYGLKEIAQRHGYNLVLHGSMQRDLDLICIPWREKVSPVLRVMKTFAKAVGGSLMKCTEDKKDPYVGKWKPHGRVTYVINLRRGEVKGDGQWYDLEYYLDISVTPRGK